MPTLRVYCLKGEGLLAGDRTTSDPYISLLYNNKKAKSKVRKNTLDEMTVGRTEVPLSSKPLPTKPEDDVKPIVRGKIGAGSYEDPAEEKRRGRPKKSGRPGR